MRNPLSLCLLFPLIFLVYGLEHFFSLGLTFPGLSLGAWLVWASAALAVERLAGERFRFVVHAAAATYFCGRIGRPEWGILLILLPVVLWVEEKRGNQWLSRAALAGCALLFVGACFRFPFALFLLPRLLWWQNLHRSGDRDRFSVTMENFLNPVYWLNPVVSAFLGRVSPGEGDPLGGLRWMGIGLGLACLHALLLHYGRAEYPFFLLGGVLTIAKISFFAAGFIKFGFARVRLPFREPWWAVDLWDFWQRAQTWIFEFVEQELVTERLMSWGEKSRMAIFLFLTWSFLLLYAPFPVLFVPVFALLAAGLTVGQHYAWGGRLRRRWLTVILLLLLSVVAFSLTERLWPFRWSRV